MPKVDRGWQVGALHKAQNSRVIYPQGKAMAVDSILSNAVAQITGAIKQAAQSTGISFEYLLTTARIESNLNPSAQASTSSAKGLYQFIDQTWLGTMKQEGAALGLSRYADAISQTSDGRYDVPDAGMRNEIMRLRNDPTVSAMLAGAFSRANASQVSAAIGRPPSEGELYIAHFLGPDGAGRMISAAANRPQESAAAMFPSAAAANPTIFYDKSGRARSVSEVYGKLTGKFETARAANFGNGLRGPVGASVASAQPAVTDTAGVTGAYASARTSLPPVADTKPLFQAMFTDRAGQPVAPVVNSLWGGANGAGSGGGSGVKTTAERGLDLFSDGQTDIRGLFGNS